MTAITKPILLDETGQKISNILSQQYEVLKSISNTLASTMKPVMYGVRIDKNDSNPATRMTYLYDAVGMNPAHMDYTNNVFDYGDWKDSPLIKSNYPCMVKFDGVEDYQLNPDDYSKKLDGSASDVADSAYGGNAMAAFLGGYIAQYEDSSYEYELWTNVNFDSRFNCEHRTDSNGVVRKGFYWNIFPVSLVSGKFRSISGLTPTASLTADAERTDAQANGAMWDMQRWSQYNYIATMLNIIGRSDDWKTNFGRGNTDGGQTGVLAGGTLNTKGQFFGSSSAVSTKAQVKVFHVEAFWGNLWRRVLGMIQTGGRYLVSMHGPYNMTGSGYTDAGATPAGVGFVQNTVSDRYGRRTLSVGGASNTYTCSYFYVNTATTAVLVLGGGAGAGSLCGFCLGLGTPASYAALDVAGALSCQMPSAA